MTISNLKQALLGYFEELSATEDEIYFDDLLHLLFLQQVSPGDIRQALQALEREGHIILKRSGVRTKILILCGYV